MNVRLELALESAIKRMKDPAAREYARRYARWWAQRPEPAAPTTGDPNPNWRRLERKIISIFTRYEGGE